MMENVFSESYVELDDKLLISDALGGSRSALEHLIRHHYQYVYNVALRFVLSPQDAQDLTQEVMIKVITKLGQFNEKASFRTWLYKIVFNHFLNSQKRQLEKMTVSFDAYGEALDNIPSTDLSAEEAISLTDEIEDAKLGCMTGMLLCLSRKQRLVYVLGEIFGLQSKTGAELLEMSPANFRKILSRSRADLYQFMHRKCGLINKLNPCRCPKKTKGFISAGWVNKKDLQFNNNFLAKISALSIERTEKCDTLLEEKYGALFQDHPFYNPNESTNLLDSIWDDKDLQEIFDL